MEASRGDLGAARDAGYKAGAGRTLAQSFCLVVGLTLVAAGILGFFFGGSGFDTGNNVNGQDFIVFEVNGWHNVVHIATGGLLLLLAPKPDTAASGAVIFGAAYVVVTVWGFVDGHDLLGLIPVDNADNWLHLALAVAGLVVGLTAGALGLAGRRQRREVGLKTPEERRRGV